MGIKIIAKNKRAHFDHFLKDMFEAGLMLKGTEIKSIRLGKANIQDAFVSIDKSMQAWLHNMLIPTYEFGNRFNHEEKRKRKLLLHAAEIKKIYDKMRQEALTVIPTKLYFKGSYVKIEIALAKGKRTHDKRETLKKKDVERKLKQGKYE